MTSENKKCSKCAYWQNGICIVLNERKNDTVCICGRFAERKEIN